MSEERSPVCLSVVIGWSWISATKRFAKLALGTSDQLFPLGSIRYQQFRRWGVALMAILEFARSEVILEFEKLY
jgi:hypothetical protein